MKPKMIVIMVVLGVFVFFLLQNRTSTPLKFLIWDTEMPLLVWIFTSIIFGFVVGWISHVAYNRGKQRAKSVKEEAKIEKRGEPKKTVKAETEKPGESPKAEGE